MAFISSNLFAPMPNSNALSALSQGLFVPQLTRELGFNGGAVGIPSWGTGEVVSLVKGPVATLSQFWTLYASSVAAQAG